MRIEDVAERHARYISILRSSYRGLAVNPTSTLDRVTAYTCIEALNCWSECCRGVIQCVMNNGTHGGNVIGWNYQQGDWIEIASRQINPQFNNTRRGEPKWYDAKNVLRVATQLAFGNQSVISAAMSSNSRVIVDLPCARNFYAHRNESTKRSAVNLFANASVPFQPHPTKLLASRTTSGVALLEDWLIDLELVIRLLY